MANKLLIAEYRYDSSDAVPEHLRDVQATTDDSFDRIDHRIRGEKVHEKIAILDGDVDYENLQYIQRAFYYNHHRPIIILEENHIGGISEYRATYDRQDNILWKKESHQTYGGNAQEDAIESTYKYVQRGRLLSEETVLNSGIGIAARIDYSYDELGRLKQKTYGGELALTETYDFNIRGWETSRLNPYFSTTLRYADPTYGVKPQYGGNISEWHWTHKSPTVPGEIAIANDPYTYAFSYDGVNRLMDTQYYGGFYFGAPKESLARSEKDLNYDLNGNILGLTRYGHTTSATPDQLQYTYTGNQLTSLGLNGRNYNYRYDANGNCIYDGKRGLDINYYYLNLTSGIYQYLIGDRSNRRSGR